MWRPKHRTKPTKRLKNYATEFSNNNPKSRQKIIEITQNYDLVDAYRHIHPELNRFTWKKTKTNKMARLDCF